MKKHRYSATDIKHVHWARLAEQTVSQELVLGVDAAKVDFFGVLMGSDLSVYATLKWKHPLQTRALSEHLVQGLGVERLAVVMEPSGTYADALCHYLADQGIAIHRVSPKRVHDAAEVYDGVPSLHDAKAAYIIARLHLDGGSRPWEPLAQSRRDHQALVAELDLYKDQHQRNLNRLEALLSRHWPEAGSILDLGRVSLLALLADYGDPANIGAEVKSAGQLLRHRGRGMLRQARVERLLDSAQDTLGVACTEGERHLIQVVASELLRSHQQIKAIEQRIGQQVEADATLTRVASVTGPATSLVLEATLGSPLDYPNAGSYLKAMGLNLKERSSGRHKGQLKITKRGPSLARKYQYFVALRWLYKDPIIAGWYHNKVRRDGRLKAKAIIAIMRKLALALWYVARGEAFDSRKLFDARSLTINA